MPVPPEAKLPDERAAAEPLPAEPLPAEPIGATVGPRFALRFEAGRGRLTLAKRHRFAWGFVEALELDLGTLRFPLDLSRGPGRFRTRRTRVVHAELRIDFPALLDDRSVEPYRVSTLAPHDEGLLVSVQDAFGVIATRVWLAMEGPDLALALGEARSGSEGPAPALVRALLAARSLGMVWEAERGCLLIRRALSALLREALVPFGWRVPDDRGISLQLEWLSPGRAMVRTGPAAPMPAAFRTAGRLAPLVAALTAGDGPAADACYLDLEERGGLDEATRAGAAALGFGNQGALDAGSRTSEGPAEIALRLREALLSGDGPLAGREAWALAEAEPCDAVAVEGLAHAAELLVHDDPEGATTLLQRAALRRPTDTRVAMRLAEILSRQGRADALARVTHDAVQARPPGAPRGRVARAAAVVCELGGHTALAGELFEIAAQSLPDDARAQEGLAEAWVLREQPERALAQFDRAARLYASDGDEDAAARVWLRGASLAPTRPDAEERVARAMAVRPDAAGQARLAQIRRELGRVPAAERAENGMLDSLQGVDAPSEAEIEGVVAALEHALEADRVERARVFLEALRRLAPERSEPFTARFDVLDVERWAARPGELRGLSARRAVSVLGRIGDVPALLSAAFPEVDGRDVPVLRQWLDAADAETVRGPLVSLLLARLEHISDTDLLLRLEAAAPDAEQAARVALAAAARFREDGLAEARARALGRAGAHRRDTAMLRAALTAAERAGATEAALEIVERALEVVGQGPARRALEAVRRRLTTP